MTSQDRTSEFFSLCQSLPASSLNSINNNSNSKNKNTSSSSQISAGRYSTTPTTTPIDPNDELRNFHSTASLISRDIYTTSTLLNKLATLIHSRSHSLFVDETPQVNTLVIQIKSNIETLNAKLDDANLMIMRNKRRLGRNSQKGMEVSNLVGQLQEEFVNTTKGFKDVLRVRSDRMKERSDRRNDLLSGNDDTNEEDMSLLGNKPKVYKDEDVNDRFLTNDKNRNDRMNGMDGVGSKLESFGAANQGDQGGFGLGMGMGAPTLDLTSAILSKKMESANNMPCGESSTQLPRPYGIETSPTSNGIRNRYGNNDKNIASYSGSISSVQNNTQQNQSSLPVYTPLDIQQMEEQSGQTQMMQLIPDQNYLRERADAMEAVETNIVELGTIFNKLAVMVNEHSEMVTRIDDNVDNANDNMMLSLNTLTDTLDNLRSNRALFFKVMTVLVVFIMTFVIFFA